MNPSLRHLRLRLTGWYVGIFALILLLLGGSLLAVLTHQAAKRLDRSLESALAETIQRARDRTRRGTSTAGSGSDAFEPFPSPGRALFVFDEQGDIVFPATAPDWVFASVEGALADSAVWLRRETSDDRTWRVYALRFELPAGHPLIAVAAADVVELQEEYFSLILAFGLAGLGSLVLVALGGSALARRSTEPVEQAFGQMRRFMADAAHELRTPLTVLRGRADVALQRSRSPEEYAAALEVIASDTERMGSMVEKMLLLSHADAGGLRLDKRNIFLDDVLIEAAEDARVLASARNVAVDIEELEETPIHADPHLVRQLLLDILDNAIRFSVADGRVRASVKRMDGGAIVTIEDEGAGIPADVLPHVFTPFFRGDAARSRSGGAGLGLAIARSIADVHGADIRLSSEPGRGTRVRITFPLAGPAV